MRLTRRLLLQSAAALGLWLMLLPAPALAWFNNSWTYRVPISIPAGSAINSTIKVDLDFNALLTSLGAAGTFDVNSPRVGRPNDVLSTTQEFTDSVYAGATDAVGNGRGEVRFLLEDAGPTTYYVYFDVTANGPKAVNPQTPINGNFERGATGTQNPPGWTAVTTNAAFDAQVRPSESPAITTDAGSPLTVTTDGTPFTGAFSYLLGSRTTVEPAGASLPAVTLSRPIVVPATGPGNLVLRFRREGWDSGENADATKYDFLSIVLAGATTTEIVGPTAGNYSTYPFSPNKGTSPVSASISGYGLYNNWDMDTKGVHHAGMTIAAGSQPWFTVTASLAAFAGQTITLRIVANQTVQYKSWTHIDDVEWSVASGTVGTPEKIQLPGGFNAYDTTTAAAAITGFIQTKIAGTAFNVDLIALNTARAAILTTFAGTVKVELLDSSSGGATDANGCNAGWSTIQTLAANPVFAAANNGRLTVAVQENNAWRNVRFRITYPAVGAATAIGCSNDNFAIRPNSFTSPVITDVDWQTAGAGRILNNSAANGGVVHRAGKPFSFGTSAVNGLAAPVVTTGYGGTPTGTLTVCGGTACSSGVGVFSTGGAAAVAGVLNSSSASYSEAGAFNLQVQDTTFASVDAGDGTPATCAGQYVCSPTVVVGRFVPDHFSLTLSTTPALKTFCAAGAFTYIGQLFTYSTTPQASIIAQNVAGATTQYYTGALWRPVGSSSYTSVPALLDTSLTTPPVIASNNNGTGTETIALADQLAYTRSLTTPPAPFNAAISLALNVTDASDVAVAGNGTITAVAAATFNGGGIGMAFSSGAAFRYGRLKIGNAFGSEAADIPVPLEAQYWNGTSFVTNTADSCTTLTAANFALGNYTKGLSAANTGTSHVTIGGAFASGKGALKLNRPSPTATGSVDLAINLGVGAATTDTSCPAWTAPVPTSNGSDKSWLRGKWCGTNYDHDPRARVTFGIYKNANEFIYLREVY